MKIEHIAMYVNELESARNFFVKYLGGVSNDGYQSGFLEGTTPYVCSISAAEEEHGCRYQVGGGLWNWRGIRRVSAKDLQKMPLWIFCWIMIC